MIINVHL